MAYTTEAAEAAAGRGHGQVVSPPTALATPSRRRTLVGEPLATLKAASDAVLDSRPYNLRGSGHSSSLTAAEIEVVDSVEVFSLFRPDWAAQAQSMAREPIRASEFLESMAVAEQLECLLVAPDYIDWGRRTMGMAAG